MITFNVPDITCGSCARRISRSLAQIGLPAEIEVQIDVTAKQVRIPATSGAGVVESVRDAIERAGYTVRALGPVNAGSPRRACCCSAPQATKLDEGQVSIERAVANCC
ncbi:MAG: heavy-metal-associated domain-containing protein [Pseudomonadota bacterium]